MNDFRLYEIGKLGANHPAYFLPGPSAIRIFRTDPAQPSRYVLPSTFYTAKASAKSNIIGMGPQSLKGCRLPLYELFLCSLERRYEGHPFRIR
jgi:hypothetical protein